MTMLMDVEDPMTSLFPTRVPEATEPMTPTESEAFAAWQESPDGRGVYRAMAAHIVDRLDGTPTNLLSVGDGEGLLSSQLAKLLPNTHVIGTDLCPEAIRRAGERHRAPNLEYRAVSVYDLEAQGYDAVVCMFTFHHFHQPQAGLARMIDALAPRGQLYLMDLRRDAGAGAYFRWIDTYVRLAPPVAPLFRASINAAHTTSELEVLLSEHAGQAEVGRVRWGAAAQAAFEAESPEGLAGFLPDADGLWVEGLFRKGPTQ